MQIPIDGDVLKKAAEDRLTELERLLLEERAMRYQLQRQLATLAEAYEQLRGDDAGTEKPPDG